jgi:uncharacterized protein YjeT (DUF2065 family)
MDKVEEPPWTAALVIEGLTAFFRSLARVGPRVSERAATRMSALPDADRSHRRLGRSALVARQRDQA